jgi:hypothetical protein
MGPGEVGLGRILTMVLVSAWTQSLGIRNILKSAKD